MKRKGRKDVADAVELVEHEHARVVADITMERDAAARRAAAHKGTGVRQWSGVGSYRVIVVGRAIILTQLPNT